MLLYCSGEEGFYATTSTLVAPSYPSHDAIDRLAADTEKKLVVIMLDIDGAKQTAKSFM